MNPQVFFLSRLRHRFKQFASSRRLRLVILILDVFVMFPVTCSMTWEEVLSIRIEPRLAVSFERHSTIRPQERIEQTYMLLFCLRLSRPCFHQRHFMMATQLPPLQEMEHLSLRVVRILGGNPGKVIIHSRY